MSRYTVRLRVQIAGGRRVIRPFIRSEYAPNTSSHADGFDTIDAAERAADDVTERYRAAGHTVIGTDIYDREKTAGARMTRA